MHAKPNTFAVSDCQGSRSECVERRGANIIVINDLPTSRYVTHLLWILACSVLGMAVFSIITSQNLSAVLSLIVVFLVSTVSMSRQTKTEINQADRTIRKTWKIGFYEKHTISSFDDISTVEVKDKSREIEGYSLPFYTVQLIGKGEKIVIFSAHEFEEAKAVCEEISICLKYSDLSSNNADKVS